LTKIFKTNGGLHEESHTLTAPARGESKMRYDSSNGTLMYIVVLQELRDEDKRFEIEVYETREEAQEMIDEIGDEYEMDANKEFCIVPVWVPKVAVTA
jgi:hypothetical protein